MSLRRDVSGSDWDSLSDFKVRAKVKRRGCAVESKKSGKVRNQFRFC